jgi:outer membrane protein assembly factor BamB
MATIAGLAFVSASGRVFAVDESGGRHVSSGSVPINAYTSAVSVGDLVNGRLFVGTYDLVSGSNGNIAVFEDLERFPLSPQLFHVTDQPVFSLYHAAGTLYVGTGGAGLIALDDRSFVPRWRLFTTAAVRHPVSVVYEGDVPKSVIFTGDNALYAVDVNTGSKLWTATEAGFFGPAKVHYGVVYYAHANSLGARSASDGALLWSFQNPNPNRNVRFGEPVIAGGVVWASTGGNQVAPAVGNKVFALRASDGSLIWEVDVGAVPTDPVVLFDHPNGLSLVAVAEQNGAAGFLQGIDANTGARLWTSNVPVSQGSSCTAPILISFNAFGFEQLLVGTQFGGLMAFSPFNGGLIWQNRLDTSVVEIYFANKPRWVGY